MIVLLASLMTIGGLYAVSFILSRNNPRATHLMPTKYRNNIDAEAVRALLRYDSLSGDFFWKKPPCNHPMKDNRAGHISRLGYRVIGINYAPYLGRRLAWLLTHDIDHIDGNRSNNAIANLRPATRKQNCWNRGGRGFYFHKPKQMYGSRICVDGRLKHLGYFDTPEAARAAYLAAAELHFGEFSFTNRPAFFSPKTNPASGGELLTTTE